MLKRDHSKFVTVLFGNMFEWLDELIRKISVYELLLTDRRNPKL